MCSRCGNEKLTYAKLQIEEVEIIGYWWEAKKYRTVIKSINDVPCNLVVSEYYNPYP